MPLFKNPWGPAYAGVGGRLRKMWELAVHPGHYPFMVGGVSAFLLISAIPVTDKDIAESKYSNRDAIMEAKKAKTGSYH